MGRWVSALAGMAALALGGCLQAEQELKLNADGSAKIKLQYAMSERAIAQLKALKESADKNPGVKLSPVGPDALFDAARLKEELKKGTSRGDEVQCRVETRNGWRWACAEISLQDLAAAVQAGNPAAGRYALARNADGNYLIEAKGGQSALGGADEHLSAEKEAQRRELARLLMAGLRVAIKITVPGDLVETTGEKKDARTAEWVLDISDAEFFEKSAAMEKNGAKAVFSGKNLNLKEFKAEPKAEKTPAKDAGKTGEPN